MLVLAKAMLALMIGFISSVIFGLMIIPFLKKIKVKQKVSIFLEKVHKKKDGTPTMGGVIFIIPTLFTIGLLLLTNKIELTYNLLIVIFVFLAYAVLGFIDDYLIIKRHSNEGLTEIQKLIGQIIIAIAFYWVYMKSGANSTIEIHTLNISINMGWFYFLFILFMLVASSNAVNITDGLDGLAGGLSVMAFLAFGLISWNAGAIAGTEDIAILCFILVGSILGFLVYNTHPAKIFMGDTGSLSLGATLGTISILTRHEFLLILIGIVFVLETLSCLIQRYYYKLTKKRIFPMAPLHHTFEKLGWNEQDIVRLFYVVGFILGAGAIVYTVWL
jgi:phospho-N-acetylmuramoyl-pentapeptide-transferase